MFDYQDFTNRNIGFVTEAEQEKLRSARVFICGTGGMGGAAIMALTRIGVGHLCIADIDHFETGNLNRQVFAFDHTLGRHKAEATADICRQINPEIDIEVFRGDWPTHVKRLIDGSVITINGTDDLGASLLLYRSARAAGKSVIDAYAAPLPSVYVTQATDEPHESRLGYPTEGTAWDALTDDQRDAAFAKEAEHVMIHSSSRHHIDLEKVGEVVAGTRSRMSFAPMVITTGMLMAYEVVNAALGRPHGADNRGWFFNPYKARVEHPRNALTTALLRPIVRRYIARLT